MKTEKIDIKPYLTPEVLNHMGLEATQNDPRPGFVKALAETALEDYLSTSQRLFAAGDGASALKLLELASDIMSFSNLLVKVLEMTQESVAKEILELAPGESRGDAKVFREVAALTKKGDLKNAWKRIRHADTYVREGVPSHCYHWLMLQAKPKEALAAILWNSDKG